MMYTLMVKIIVCVLSCHLTGETVDMGHYTSRDECERVANTLTQQRVIEDHKYAVCVPMEDK